MCVCVCVWCGVVWCVWEFVSVPHCTREEGVASVVCAAAEALVLTGGCGGFVFHLQAGVRGQGTSHTLDRW